MALARSVGLLALLVSVQGLTREQLFDYGIRVGDKILDSGTDSVRELELEQTLFFFKGKFDKVYVSNFSNFIASFSLCSFSIFFILFFIFALNINNPKAFFLMFPMMTFKWADYAYCVFQIIS